MQTTAFNRPYISSTQGITADDANKANGASHAGTLKGYGHLLEGITLADALKKAGFEPGLAEIIGSFLIHGKFPATEQDVNLLANWLMAARQPNLLCKVLSIAPARISVYCEEVARCLLESMQSGLSFSGMTLGLNMAWPEEALKKIVPLLEQAFQANPSLTAIELFCQSEDFNELTPLFEVLAEVKNLTFIERAGKMSAANCALLSNLLSKNKTMRALELYDLGADDIEDQDNSVDAGSLSTVFDQLAGQSQLERLSLSKVPQHKQSQLGYFLCSSQSLTDLRIGLRGLAVAESLIAAFGQTVSIENVHLELPNLEDGMLPLIAGIAKNKGSIKNHALITREGWTHIRPQAYVT